MNVINFRNFGVIFIHLQCFISLKNAFGAEPEAEDPTLEWPTQHKVVYRMLPTLRRACATPCANRSIELLASDSQRTIVSPNYPRPYCASATCAWTIRGAPRTRVRFLANNFDVRIGRDYVLFFNDLDTEKYAHNCTDSKRRCEFVSAGPLMVVRFVTGTGSQDAYGFQAIISLIPKYEAVDKFENEDRDKERFLLFFSSVGFKESTQPQIIDSDWAVDTSTRSDQSTRLYDSTISASSLEWKLIVVLLSLLMAIIALAVFFYLMRVKAAQRMRTKSTPMANEKHSPAKDRLVRPTDMDSSTSLTTNNNY